MSALRVETSWLVYNNNIFWGQIQHPTSILSAGELWKRKLSDKISYKDIIKLIINSVTASKDHRVMSNTWGMRKNILTWSLKNT